MNKLKKLLTIAISFSLLITTIPVSSFAASYPVLPQYEFSNFAKITSANFCENSDTTIINIQDLHNNKEVQDNIYKLLEKLDKYCTSLDVYIEGASDDIDYSKLSSSLNEKELSALMESLYANDKLSGAEFFGYKNSKVLKPTEQKNIYDRNIQNYSFLIKNKQKISELLLNKYTNIKSLNDYLIKDQISLLKFYNAYLNKKVSSEFFYKKILVELSKRKIPALKYVNTKLYIDVLNASKNINQKLAERQLQSVLVNLKNTITYQEYVNLLQDSKNLSDINVIFAYLSEKTKSADKFTKYPDLFRLINLREISSLINPLELVEEEREMMEDILLSYSKTTENKDVVFINLFFQIYKKLLLASISSNEYSYYKQNYGRFVNLYSKYVQNDNLFDLYRYLVVAENFNELNLERNISFVDNLVSGNKNINEENNYRGKFYNINKILSGLDKTKNVKVIISGGFHTEGVNELLKKKNVSYITLTPNVKETDLMYEQNYLDSIVEQAQVDTNAISKRPWLEQKAPMIVNDIMVSLDTIIEHLSNKKDFKEIEDIVNGAIKATLQNNAKKDNVEDYFISFNFNSNDEATITVDDKEYVLTFENGKIEIKKDSSTPTTLAKNIKLLIKKTLGIDTIKLKLSVSDQDTKPEGDGIGVVNQIAANLLMNQNILLPWFANRVMRAIIGLEPADEVTSSREYKVLEKVLKEQYEDLGEEYPEINSENNPIKIGKSPLLIGAQQDGYGNVKEYASLFYVVWGTNSVGASVVKEIFISNTLFSYLKDFSEKEVRQFFQTLITHERLEIIAVSGESKRYNSHHKDFARTSDGFHKYIKKGSDFAEFVKEQGYSTEVVKSQRKLLEQLDDIIAKVNEQNSEYSGIISLVSMGENSSYSDKDIARFLAVRSGEKETISKSKIEIADEICKKLKQEYDIANSTFDIKSFVKFVNDEYAFVYKKSNDYMLFSELPDLVKELLKNRYVREWSNSEDVSSSQIDDIVFPTCEVDEDEPLSFEQKEIIYGKNIFFVEDIISRNSKTYNRIYKKLTDSEVTKVQPFVFFDLSKEAKGENIITGNTYAEIVKDPKLLFNVISKTNGEVKKYIFYWLVKLSKDSKGIKILQQLAKQDNEIVRNLIVRMFDILKNGETILNVKNTEIVELILLMGLGEKKAIDDITQEDLTGLLEKYNIKLSLDLSKQLTVKYDDWKDNIPYLITYAAMCGYDYIDANGINNIYENIAGNDKTNRDLIEQFCKKFNISLIDKKTKLKYFHFSEREIENAEALIDETFTNKIAKLINEYKNAKISYTNFENFIEDELQQLFDDAQGTKSERIRLMKEKEILKRKYIEKGKMERTKYHFEKYTKFYEEKYASGEYSYDEYIEAIERAENDYRKAVKKAMINAKNIALDELKLDKILMDDSMFAVIIGGSLAKGNSMKDSDIYYDIIVKNGVISKSIEQYFTPLYSSILRDFGLVNYQVFKYSTTSLDKRNINTFVDEQEVTPFLNYELLEADNKKCAELYKEYMHVVMRDSLKESSTGIDTLDFVARMYYTISETGKGWIGKSFHSVYSEDKDKIFTTRWSLMSFEAILNKMIFQYIAKISYGSKDFDFDNLPISVEEQVELLKHSVFSNDETNQKRLDEVLNAWKFLSANRYGNNNTWTDFIQEKKNAIDTINDFVKDYLEEQEKKSDTSTREVKNSRDFLKVIEEFVYDNSTNLQVFRIGYDKYSHLEQWRDFARDKETKEDTKPEEDPNFEAFIKAQAIVLLLEMDDTEIKKDTEKDDSETIRDKLRNLKIPGLDEYLPSLFKSLDAIKKIDEQFKDFEDMQGERSLQNYWDLVAKTAENEETLLALIAHKLTQAKYPNPEKYTTEEKMHEAKNRATLLVHSVYLPLSRRFGNSDMYEYVRNDLFEISNPQEYLNLLNIIETLYGVQYTELKKINEDIKIAAENLLQEQGLPKDSAVVKFRPKSLYSMHEKLNSERRKGEIIHTIGKTEKGLVKFILRSDDPLFKAIFDSAKTKDTKKTDIEFILKHIDSDYDSLDDKQKELVNKLVSETRSKIFADYELVNYIKKTFDALPKEFLDDSGLREMNKLRTHLENNQKWVELFFVDIFSKELKDLIGLHIVIENEEYDKHVTNDMIKAFSESFGSNFDKFERDYNNKQARIKFSALKKSLPIEACLYKKVDYEEEIYGFYNLETLSAPHYQYKTGRKIEIYPEIEELIQELKTLEDKETTTKKEAEELESKISEIRNKIKVLMNLVLFDGTFIHEIALKFVVKDIGEERKQFVFTPDEYTPEADLDKNRSQIFENKNLGNRTIFFVEYEGGYFVMDLPKDATVNELVNSKYFADVTVAVYDEDGNPKGMDVKVEDAKVYKIIKTETKSKAVRMTDEELKRKPIRTQLQYLLKTGAENKSISTSFSEKIAKKSDLSEFAAYLLFYENNSVMFDDKELSDEDFIDKLYDPNSRNEILRNKELLAEALDIISKVMDNLELEDIAPSVFVKRSVMIANHYNLSNMFELFEALDYGVINYSDIINYYKTCIFIKTKSEKVNEKQILELLSDKLGAKITGVDTRKKPNARYNLIVNDRKYFVDYEGYEFEAVQNLLESQDIHFEYVADKSSREIGKKENKEKIFITMDFARPRKFLPLMSLGNNVAMLVQHAIINHSELVSIILQDIRKKVVSDEKVKNPELSEDEINMLPMVRTYSLAIELVEKLGVASKKVKKEHPGEELNVFDYEELDDIVSSFFSLFSQPKEIVMRILLGLYRKESYTYDEEAILSRDTPYLTSKQAEIVVNNIKEPKLSEISDLLGELGIDTKDFSTGISSVNFVVSRSLDLVEDMSTFSFATLEVTPEGIATVYISEAFLRELDREAYKKYREGNEHYKEDMLKQLALHEIIEYLALKNSANTYEKVHEIFETYHGQRDLMSFVKSIAVKNTLRRKEALYQEVDTLLSPSDFTEMDPQSTIGLLLGNLNISSFVRTYKLYRGGKLSKIFISGNKRGSLRIIRNLRNPEAYTEYNNLVEEKEQTRTSKDNIRTVKDLLSLTKSTFDGLNDEDIATVQIEINDEPLLLDEKLTSPISRDEIFYLVSEDGVTEAAIIKWIILESARQDGLTRKEINQLIKSIVLETKASNTPENIANIFAKKEFRDFIQDKDDIDVVIIQTPFSQTRAGSTLKKFLNENVATFGDKNFDIYNMSFDLASETYHYGNVSALKLSLGEWTRLIAYSLKGDIVPLVDNKEGLKEIPLDILVNLLSLLPLLNAEEKASLFKVFSDAAKQDENFKKENMDKLLDVLEQQIGSKEEIAYILIAEFIKYIYADTTEQRQLEKDWDELIIRQEVPEVDLEQELSLENRMETMQSILSAA